MVFSHGTSFTSPLGYNRPLLQSRLQLSDISKHSFRPRLILFIRQPPLQWWPSFKFTLFHALASKDFLANSILDSNGPFRLYKPLRSTNHQLQVSHALQSRMPLPLLLVNKIPRSVEEMYYRFWKDPCKAINRAVAASAENGEQLLAETGEDMKVVRRGEGGELYVDAHISVGQLAANNVFVGREGEVGGYADVNIV